jgi:hypothetical protein
MQLCEQQSVFVLHVVPDGKQQVPALFVAALPHTLGETQMSHLIVPPHPSSSCPHCPG